MKNIQYDALASGLIVVARGLVVVAEVLDDSFIGSVEWKKKPVVLGVMADRINRPRPPNFKRGQYRPTIPDDFGDEDL